MMIPTGLVKLTTRAVGQISSIRRPSLSTSGMMRIAIAKPAGPVVSCPITPYLSGISSSMARARSCPARMAEKTNPAPDRASLGSCSALTLNCASHCRHRCAPSLCMICRRRRSTSCKVTSVRPSSLPVAAKPWRTNGVRTPAPSSVIFMVAPVGWSRQVDPAGGGDATELVSARAAAIATVCLDSTSSAGVGEDDAFREGLPGEPAMQEARVEAVSGPGGVNRICRLGGQVDKLAAHHRHRALIPPLHHHAAAKLGEQPDGASQVLLTGHGEGFGLVGEEDVRLRNDVGEREGNLPERTAPGVQRHGHPPLVCQGDEVDGFLGGIGVKVPRRNM